MTRYIPVITHNKHISTPPTLAGLFFCLASAESARLFCFALLQYNPIQAFTVAFVLSMQLYSQCRKTAHRALQWRFLRFVPFYCHKYQTDTSGYNTACATLERITAPGRAQPIPEQAPRRALYRSAQPPYYNNVYKRSADHASPAGSAPAVCGSLASANTLSAAQTRRTC